jgi:hypothetical protein
MSVASVPRGATGVPARVSGENKDAGHQNMAGDGHATTLRASQTHMAATQDEPDTIHA